jgi:putative hydrolase of the HAD superfamily
VRTSIEKLGISKYFDVVLVSGDYGWRKPHRKIFQAALDQLGVSVQETVFLGDSPLEDIKGAADLGLKTIFVQSQFYGEADLAASGQKPTHTVADLEQLCSVYAAYVEH